MGIENTLVVARGEGPATKGRQGISPAAGAVLRLGLGGSYIMRLPKSIKRGAPAWLSQWSV